MDQLVTRSALEVRPLSAHVGAEIAGIDLREPLGDEDCARIRAAFNQWGVVFFRDQVLTPAQHLAFAERFGAVEQSRALAHVPGFPTINEVRKEPEQRRNIGGNWHTDHAYDAVPLMASVLLARELPPVGGDTIFASMYAAYDALSDGLKRTLEGLRAIHAKGRAYDTVNSAGDRTMTEEERARIHRALADLEAVHEVAPRHPESGRRLLYVNPQYTVRFDGWTVQESEPLLRYLFQHATRPEFTCRFQWREGSIAFWDNRSTLHYALNDYHGERRLMHRVTLEGPSIA